MDEYCKKQNVMGIANVDTRAIIKALRDTGCLVGVITQQTHQVAVCKGSLVAEAVYVVQVDGARTKRVRPWGERGVGEHNPVVSAPCYMLGHGSPPGPISSDHSHHFPLHQTTPTT